MIVEKPETRALTVVFTRDEYQRLINADHLAETGDLAAFARAATLDKVGLIERLTDRETERRNDERGRAWDERWAAMTPDEQRAEIAMMDAHAAAEAGQP